MEIAALDGQFNKLLYLRYINLQWTRRYYTFGEFSVQIPLHFYDGNMAYIYADARPELGIVQKVEITNTSTGDYAQLSGYFYEYRLIDKVIYPLYNGYGTAEKIAHELFNRYKEDSGISAGSLKGIGTTTALQESDAELGKKLYSFLQTQELSYKIGFNYETKNFVFEVWQGTDRTQDQTANNFVVFSDSRGNLTDLDLVMDSSNYKNYAIVIGNGEYVDGKQIAVYVDHSLGGYKRKLFVDKKSEHLDTTQTRQEYESALAQAGEEALLKYTEITNIEFSVNPEGFSYPRDFDLGDKCDIVIDSVGLAFTARITEIFEVFKENRHTVTLSIGDKVPTNYEKARQ